MRISASEPSSEEIFSSTEVIGAASWEKAARTEVAADSLDAGSDLELYWSDSVNDIFKNLVFQRQTVPITVRSPESEDWVSFLSNDYLGLSRHPEVISRAQNELQQNGLSSCSSRVVGGTSLLHQQLEQRLAAFYGVESTLLFSSGYMANLGAVTQLASRDDALILDRLCHASLYDAAALSKAKLFRFQHNNLQHLHEILEKFRTTNPTRGMIVVTESVFSMDGDVAPLAEIAALCLNFGAALLVDDAHSIGRPIIPLSEYLESKFVQTITLSKVFGGTGGAVGCSEEMRTQLVEHSRPFIYDTALAPLQAAGVLAALDIIERKAIDPAELHEKAAYFRDLLQHSGFDTGLSSTQIIPLIIGDEALTIAFREQLREYNILVGAIRSPSVPVGKARLRFSVNLGHSRETLAQVAEIVSAVGKKLEVV